MSKIKVGAVKAKNFKGDVGLAVTDARQGPGAQGDLNVPEGVSKHINVTSTTGPEYDIKEIVSENFSTKVDVDYTDMRNLSQNEQPNRQNEPEPQAQVQTNEMDLT